MTKLEQSIITQATNDLKMIQGFAGKRLSISDRHDIIAAFQSFGALEQLVLYTDCGLSEESINAMKVLQASVAKAMASVNEGQDDFDMAPPALAAIRFALQLKGNGLAFLRAWDNGEFDDIRENWPDAPEAVFLGVDIFHVPRAH